MVVEVVGVVGRVGACRDLFTGFLRKTVKMSGGRQPVSPPPPHLFFQNLFSLSFPFWGGWKRFHLQKKANYGENEVVAVVVVAGVGPSELRDDSTLGKREKKELRRRSAGPYLGSSDNKVVVSDSTSSNLGLDDAGRVKR